MTAPRPKDLSASVRRRQRLPRRADGQQRVAGRTIVKRAVATVCVLWCASALAAAPRTPELSRLKQQLEPVFRSVGLANQPALSATAAGMELQGGYHEGKPDGFSIRAVLLAGRPEKRDNVLARCAQTSDGWVYSSSIPTKPNGSIAIVFRYGEDADSNAVERIKSVIERQHTAKAAEPDARAVTEASGLFEAQDYSNCVAFCGSHSASLGAPGLFIAAECYARLDDIPAAVRELQDVETFYEGDASRAVMRIATLQRQAGQKRPYVAALRRLAKKYPESKEGKEAEELLRQMSEAEEQVEVK